MVFGTGSRTSMLLQYLGLSTLHLSFEEYRPLFLIVIDLCGGDFFYCSY
jgi:hypothetical protein